LTKTGKRKRSPDKSPPIDKNEDERCQPLTCECRWRGQTISRPSNLAAGVSGRCQPQSDEHALTTQVAPTILKALDLDPDLLQSVAVEGTRTLPGPGLRGGE
jgi:hypothetical protein